MSDTPSPALQHEWATLQNNIEQYEKSALAIKLVAVAVFVAALVYSLAEGLTAALIVVLWVQEAVLRTFQSRLGERILRVEEFLAAGTGAVMQLHTEWRANRPGTAGMLIEYARQALRPTVAFPYFALLAIDLAFIGAGSGADVLPTT
jgi:hypothetical protein